MTRALRRTLALLAVALVACQDTGPIVLLPTPAPQRTVAVIVSAAAGAPVVGANVCAVTVSGREERCGETGASGTARLRVRPGAYALRVAPPAGTRFHPGQGWADAVFGDTTAVIELWLESKISGTVRDEGGRPVANAEACAHPASTEPVKCAKTNGEGAYTLEVKADVYKVEVTGSPGGRLMPQWAKGRLNSGEADIIDVRTADAKSIDLTLVRGVVLRGTVRGPDGPVEEAQVCMRTLAAPLPWECDRTDEDGHYISLREVGRYYVWVIPPDRVRLVAQWYEGALTGFFAQVLTLDGDRTLDVRLAPGPQLRGTVRDPDGVPVLNAFVCVDTPFPTGRICRPTDGNGVYEVTTRPETYIVQVLPPNDDDFLQSEYWSRKRTWVDADEVRLGNADRTLDIQLRRGDRLYGYVRDRRGIPLEGATLNLHDGEGPLVGVATDHTGRYTFVVPAGTYRIEVFAPGRGERGDLLSQEPRDVSVSGATRHDVVLEDADP